MTELPEQNIHQPNITLFMSSNTWNVLVYRISGNINLAIWQITYQIKIHHYLLPLTIQVLMLC